MITIVRLVVSDVDGTLVTPDKRLTEANVAAVRDLEAAGIAFTIASSRPPVGMRMFVAPLDLRHPIGAFNGGAIVDPDGTVLEEHLIPEAAATEAVAAFRAFGAEIWVFAGGLWLLERPDGAFVPRERRTIQTAPVAVTDLAPHLARAGKIVAASEDHAGLARLEGELRGRLGTSAAAARSQPYYLDVTPPGVDKGTLVAAIARRLGVALADVLTIGDAHNDVPMFGVSGHSVAMGNAAVDVKAHAKAVTGTNEESGFAEAMRRVLKA